MACTTISLVQTTRGVPLEAGFHESYLWQVTTGKQLKNGGGERFWSPPLERNGVDGKP